MLILRYTVILILLIIEDALEGRHRQTALVKRPWPWQSAVVSPKASKVFGVVVVLSRPCKCVVRYAKVHSSVVWFIRDGIKMSLNHTLVSIIVGPSCIMRPSRTGLADSHGVCALRKLAGSRMPAIDNDELPDFPIWLHEFFVQSLCKCLDIGLT